MHIFTNFIKKQDNKTLFEPKNLDTFLKKNLRIYFLNLESLFNPDSLHFHSGILRQFQIVDGMRKVVGGDPGSSADEVKSLLEEYVHKRAEETVTDFLIIESSARAPFAFCSELINNLRQMIRVCTIFFCIFYSLFM